MVSCKCVHEGGNKVNEFLEFNSEQGLKLELSDERGEILKIECSCQPKTTIIRIRVYGRISVNNDKEGVAIIRRI